MNRSSSSKVLRLFFQRLVGRRPRHRKYWKAWYGVYRPETDMLMRHQRIPRRYPIVACMPDM